MGGIQGLGHTRHPLNPTPESSPVQSSPVRSQMRCCCCPSPWTPYATKPSSHRCASAAACAADAQTLAQEFQAVRNSGNTSQQVWPCVRVQESKARTNKTRTEKNVHRLADHANAWIHADHGVDPCKPDHGSMLALDSHSTPRRCSPKRTTAACQCPGGNPVRMESVSLAADVAAVSVIKHTTVSTKTVFLLPEPLCGQQRQQPS